MAALSKVWKCSTPWCRCRLFHPGDCCPCCGLRGERAVQRSLSAPHPAFQEGRQLWDVRRERVGSG